MPKDKDTVEALVHLEKKLEAVLTEVRDALTDHENERTAVRPAKLWKDSFSEDKERYIAP